MRNRKKRGRQRPVMVVLCLIALVLSVGFIRFQTDLVVTESTLMLVNKERRLPSTYVPSDLTTANVQFAPGTLNERKKMRAEAAEALEKLFNAAAEQGLNLIAVSGYRSYRTQNGIYQTRLDQAGLSYVSRYIAEAGASEHQTGLAMDLACDECTDLIETFAQTDEYRYLVAHAHEYGFIIRYPSDGEGQTGYAFEPWHLRYVGDEAQKIVESGMTMEAYMHANYPDLSFVSSRQTFGPFVIDG